MKLLKKVFSNITTWFLISLGFFWWILILVKAASITATSWTPLTASNWNNMVSNFFWGSWNWWIFYNWKVWIWTNSPNKSLHVYNTTDNAEIDLQSVAWAWKHWAIYQDATTQELRLWNEYDRFKLTTWWNLNVQWVCINWDCKTAWAQVTAQAWNIKSCTCSDTNSAICIQTFDWTNRGNCIPVTCKAWYAKSNSVDSTCTIVNWTCGSSNWQSFSSTPTTNLCSIWTPSSVSYSSTMWSYTWNCVWWTTSSCKAYDSYTVLLIHWNWTNWSTSITDSSPKNKSINRNWNTAISTTNSKFWWSSIYFDWSSAVNSSFWVASDSDLYFWAWDFTMEVWVRPAATTNMEIISKRPGSTACWPVIMIYPSWSYWFWAAWIYWSNGLTIWPATTNVWTHIAVTRSGSTIYMFKDWVLLNTYNASSTAISECANEMRIWQDMWWVWMFNWYLDEIRISKWIARRTSTFTPPTTEY